MQFRPVRCTVVGRCTTKSTLAQVRPSLLYFINSCAVPFEYGRIKGKRDGVSAQGCACSYADTPLRRPADTVPTSVPCMTFVRPAPRPRREPPGVRQSDPNDH